MTTRLEWLEAEVLKVRTIITELTTNPKPSYNIDGQSVTWESYLKTMRETEASMQDQIDMETGSNAEEFTSIYT